MTTEIKRFREEIWMLIEYKIQALFENAEDEEEELVADLGVDLSIGKYAGATTWSLSNAGGELIINVYPSGQVNVYLDEACHSEKQIDLCEKLQDTNTNIEQIVIDIATLVDVFLEASWHVFMDLMSHNDCWKTAITEYKEYLISHPDEIIDTTYLCS